MVIRWGAYNTPIKPGQGASSRMVSLLSLLLTVSHIPISDSTFGLSIKPFSVRHHAFAFAISPLSGLKRSSRIYFGGSSFEARRFDVRPNLSPHASLDYEGLNLPLEPRKESVACATK
jgi:hypothetical protein